MSDINYIFNDMNTEAQKAGYTPDNRYRYIRPTELAPIIPGSYVVHQFYLIDPEVNDMASLSEVKVQYAFGLQKLFEKVATLVQLVDACEVTVQLLPGETDEFLRKFPEIDVYKEPYLSAHCQLIITKTDDKVIYSEIQNIKVKLPLNKYIDERVYENDNT